MKPELVFVYGTLKEGFGNWGRLLANKPDVKALGTATVEGIMFHIGGYPAVCLEEPLTRIHGEVYEVSLDVMQQLDYLEGVPGHYVRSQVKTPYSDKTWIYVYPHARAEKCVWVVPTGTWNGPQSPRMHWLGFGRGFAVGSLEDVDQNQYIPLSQSNYRLVRSKASPHMMDMVKVSTGEILGTYRYLGDVVNRNGKTVPKISVPAVITPPEKPSGSVIHLPNTTPPKEPKRPVFGPGRREA